MRAIDTAADKILRSRSAASHLRVLVKMPKMTVTAVTAVFTVSGASRSFGGYRLAVRAVGASFVADVYKDGQLIGSANAVGGVFDVGAVEFSEAGVFTVSRIAGYFVDGDSVSFFRGPDNDWCDLTTLRGRNWIVGANWREDVDQPVASAEVELVRECQQLSLATLMESSRLNLDASVAAYAPMLDLKREVQIQTATLPAGATPGQSDWRTMFHGIIDSIDDTSSPARLELRDLGARYQDAYLERERIFGYGVDAGIEFWQPNHSYEEHGERDAMVVIPSTPNGWSYFQSYVGGEPVSGPTEPAWPTSGPGTTVNDGTCIWWQLMPSGTSETLQSALDNVLRASGFCGSIYGWEASPLAVVGDPAWAISPYRQERAPVLDILRRLAQMIGWDVRMRWNESAQAFKLTLFQVDRAKTTPDRVLGPGDYTNISSLRLSAAGIRNSVTVHYSDASDLQPDGVTRRRKSVTVEDDESQARFGRIWCEIGEASSSLIDSATEAQRLADAVLNDLRLPHLEKQVELPYFWPAELGDLYGFAPNGVHYSAQQNLAVVGYEHALSSDGGARTTLTVRGNVAGGYRTWHAKLARPGVARSHRQDAPSAPTAPSVVAGAGSAQVTFSPPAERFEEAELHVSTVSGFTPSADTLYARGRVSSFTVQEPAGTYYGRLVVRDEFGNFSAPGAQFTIAIGEEAWHVVGTSGEPAFEGNWQQAPTAAVVAFFKDSTGMVHIKGTARCTSAGAGTAIFTLPLGYRPSETLLLGVGQYDGAVKLAELAINSNGNVSPTVFSNPGGNADIKLSCVSFRAA